MKKLLKLALILTVAFALVVPAHAAYKDMWAKVYSWDGRISNTGKMVLTEITSGITYAVLMKDSSATLETLYYYGNDAYTSLANPVTGTNFASDSISGDRVAFRVDPAETNDTAVDLMVTDQAGGYSAFVENFDVYTHTIVIDERPNVKHHGYAFIDTGTASTDIDTGIDFDRPTIIHDMIVEVGLAFPTNMYLDVGLDTSGTNGLSQGFIDGMGLGTAGYHQLNRPGVDLTLTMVNTNSTSSWGYYISDASATSSEVELNIGTWLGHIEFAVSTGETNAIFSQGGFLRQELMIHGTWEQTLVYSFGTTSASTGWGVIHYWFTRIR
jgi:hypothetical protein